MSLGAHNDQKPVGDEEKALFAQFATEISAQANGAELVAETFSTQVVNGTNYRFIAKAGDAAYVVVIYKKGQWDGGEASLTSVTAQ